jgi:hypothetical protein
MARYGDHVDQFLDDVLEVLKLSAGIGDAVKPLERWCPDAGLAYMCRKTGLSNAIDLWSRDHL